MKIFDEARIHLLGDAALTCVFGSGVSPEINARVLRARAAVEAAGLAGVIETVAAFAALTVYFDPDTVSAGALTDALRDLHGPAGEAEGAGQTWEIPVLYDGPDLSAVAAEAGIAETDIVRAHAGTAYHVYMLGFLPGFAYLGDLPATLRLPRLNEPRTRVPTGSVAIADRLTAIYPFESPGGWRLIGRTPLRPFDHRRVPPALFRAGDTVRFRPVDRAEFDRLHRESGT